MKCVAIADLRDAVLQILSSMGIVFEHVLVWQLLKKFIAEEYKHL